MNLKNGLSKNNGAHHWLSHAIHTRCTCISRLLFLSSIVDSEAGGPEACNDQFRGAQMIAALLAFSLISSNYGLANSEEVGGGGEPNVPARTDFITPLKGTGVAKEVVVTSPGGSECKSMVLSTPPGGSETGRERKTRCFGNARRLRRAQAAAKLPKASEAEKRAAASQASVEKKAAAFQAAKSFDNKKYYNKCKSAGKKKNRDAEEDARQAERYRGAVLINSRFELETFPWPGGHSGTTFIL